MTTIPLIDGIAPFVAAEPSLGLLDAVVAAVLPAASPRENQPSDPDAVAHFQQALAKTPSVPVAPTLVENLRTAIVNVAATPLERMPVETSVIAPAVTPAPVVADVLPTPVHTSVDVVTEPHVVTPVDTPVVVPVEQPVVATVESPVVATVEQPVVVPMEQPAVATVESPVVVPVEQPVVATVESPVVATVEQPVVVSVEQPVVVSVEQPVVATVEQPVVVPMEQPVVATVESPAVVTVESPVVVPVEQPATATVEPSAVIPVEAPIVETPGSMNPVSGRAETVVKPVAESLPVDERPMVETVVRSAVPADDPEVEVAAPTAEALVAAGVTPAVVPQPVADAPQALEVMAPQAAVTLAETNAPQAAFVQAATAVADTILVTPGLLRGQGEIRIQLKESVLDGTEIVLSVTGRELEVAFVPPVHDTAVLVENALPQLQSHLAARIRSYNIALSVRRRTHAA